MLPDIILDRDGVINHDSPDYIKSPSEWKPLKGSIEAIADLKKAGYRVFVATNQSGVGRGLYTEQVLHTMHQKMALLLQEYSCELDGIYFCPHVPNEQCSCRKPLPGMLFQIAHEHQVTLTNAFYIGDSRKDLDAAQAAGTQGVLVLTGNGQRTKALIQEGSVPIFENLYAFSNFLLQDKKVR